MPGTTILDLDARTADAMAGTLRLAKHDMARAQAVWAANKYKAFYLTTEPREVVALVPPDQVHPIPTRDA